MPRVRIWRWRVLVWLFWVVVLLSSAEIRNHNNGGSGGHDGCQYDPSRPFNTSTHPPWSVIIRPTKRSIFVGAILDSHTIITTSDAFRAQTPGKIFQIKPFANYTIRVGLDDKIQKMKVSYIKPHPLLAPRPEKWTLAANDIVLIYLSEPINFIPYEVGPVCLPNVTFMKQLEKLNPDTRGRLEEIWVGGLLSTNSVGQSSYTARLNTFDWCDGRWNTDSITKGCACHFRKRACALVTRPTPTATPSKSCVLLGRDSGAVLPLDNQLFLLGFQNYYLRVGNTKGCDPDTFVYISLLVPDVLEWIRQDMRCGPTKFSCDGGTRCVDLKYVCDGKTHSCEDRSDQNSNFCESRVGCGPHERGFTCSTGLASYCIPAIDNTTGRAALNCNGERDCPNGEDEDPEICDEQGGNKSGNDTGNTKLAVSFGSSMAAVFAAATLAMSAYALVRKRRWQLEELRDMTEEELIDFFEGERHLQIAPAFSGISINRSVEGRAGDGEAITDAGGQVVYVETMATATEDGEKSGDGDSGHLTDSSMDELQIRRGGYDASRSFLFMDPSQCVPGEQIGRGAFGVVLRGTVLGRAAGIKFPNLDLGISAFKVLLLELKILRYIDEELEAAGGHPNIVRLIAADTSRIRQRILYVALKFYENGNLEEYLTRRRAEFKRGLCGPPVQSMVVNPANPKYHLMKECYAPFQLPYRRGCEVLLQLFRWAAQISCGMSFLAGRIHHLDLAVRNVLVDVDLVAKVGDFSLSRRAPENGKSYHIQRRDKLPAQWLPLEVLTEGRCARKSDVWSYGVTLYELFSLCEEEPWGELRRADGKFDAGQLVTRLEAEERLPAPRYASDEVYGQMQACWRRDPNDRPEFEKLQTFFEELLQNLL